MIRVNNLNIGSIYYGSKSIKAVYKGVRLIWNKIKDFILCCFANGYWQDQYPWRDDIAWKD